MRKKKTKSNPTQKNHAEEREKGYTRLSRKFIFYTIVCSALPLLLVGWGINLHYSSFAQSRMITDFKSRIDNHRRIIQLFLDERLSELQVIAGSQKLDKLVIGSNLENVFNLINEDKWTFTDLGVIDENGDHLRYVGPYNLINKNYAKTFWFKEVMEKGLYISDMFLGFRKEPHFVIAVAKTEKNKKWILRATIDTDFFRSLTENVWVGKTGEVYLVNQKGIFQTSPRFEGKIMDKAPFRVGDPSEGIVIEQWPAGVNENGVKRPKKIVGRTWLDKPNWMLLVRQDYDEAFDAVNHANIITLIFLHVSVLTILIAAVLITRHMIGIIRSRDREADNLNNQLMQTSKLAAIGELSAGVAHEINNPLAIILTERQILLDQFEQSGNTDETFGDRFVNSLSQIGMQVQRCKRITHNLLRFSRRTESVIEPIDLNSFLKEVIDLVEREAKAGGILFISEFADELPLINSDPSQLQQVFLNLITNAIDAHDGKPFGSIQISTAFADEKGVEIAIADTGCGIAPAQLNRIFDPFFTTKQVGKGTGLGLSICYSIVRNLGGIIKAESDPGQGSVFTLILPIEPPIELKKALKENGGGPRNESPMGPD